ncbi:hypothetical protein [Sphingobacterium sp. BIGb0165]|uniref:hypothetical protein n=1 Tax=Sphingobacterium sp. BIGb0165 TaxID=2940615 RepID=UPI0021689437|nr:hypothetical protein [Sphingobacterium sp. BIGb0165]MCS4227145.1 hypothetical protein [Sphingobacterium sp. BIGb0165]
MDKIDSGNTFILRNKLKSTPQTLRLKNYLGQEGFFSNDINQPFSCLVPMVIDISKHYQDIFFIKKEKGQYKQVLMLSNVEDALFQAYRKQITSSSNFENIKNENERFSKTLDWFIENGLLPDGEFIAYYKQKGITTDSILYTEKQYQTILQQFQLGHEDLLSLIKKKYPEEVKQYYTQKMKDILLIEGPDYNNYYDFDKAISALTDSFNSDTSSADYILCNALTSEKFEKYEKRDIMVHLLKVVSEWK